MEAELERPFGLSWRKSRYSANGGGCVEVASTSTFVLVRDSRERSGRAIQVTSAQWSQLLVRIRRDRPDCR